MRTTKAPGPSRAQGPPRGPHGLAGPRPRPPLSAAIQRAMHEPHMLTRANVTQLQQTIGNAAVARLLAGMPPRENRTGLPDGLKAGIEHLSGLAMDDVRVH